MTQFLNNVNVSAKAVTASQGVLIGTQTTMPPASVYNVGCTVQYVGTAGTYTPGRLYTCVQEGTGYQWVESSLISTGLDVGTADRAIITDGAGMAVASGVSATELGYLSGVTAGIQGQLNGKVPTSRTINGKPLTDNITLSASDIGAAPSSSVLEASRALQSSSNGEVSVSNVTAVELSYLSGVTSAIQTQLSNKANKTDIPTLLSQLTNDTGFVTDSVSSLINYYTKDDTYSQEEINNMISAIPKFSIQVVQSLPSSNISTTTIYLVPKTASTNDAYDEYIYVNNTWEKIGSTAVSLDDYYTKAQVNAMVTPAQSASGITLNGVALQTATSARAGLMTVEQVGQLATAVSNAQSALNGNVTGGTFSTDSSGNLTLTLNRTAGALNIGPTALTAAKAVADGNGNNIASTYATQSALTSGLAGKANAGTEITGGAFSNGTIVLSKSSGNITISGIYAPTSSGSSNQYWRSDGSGTGVWTTPASSPSSSSNTLISAKGAYRGKPTGLEVTGSGTDSLQVILTLGDGSTIESNTFSRNRGPAFTFGLYHEDFNGNLFDLSHSMTRYVHLDRYSRGYYTEDTISGYTCSYYYMPLSTGNSGTAQYFIVPVSTAISLLRSRFTAPSGKYSISLNIRCRANHNGDFSEYAIPGYIESYASTTGTIEVSNGSIESYSGFQALRGPYISGSYSPYVGISYIPLSITKIE